MAVARQLLLGDAPIPAISDTKRFRRQSPPCRVSGTARDCSRRVAAGAHADTLVIVSLIHARLRNQVNRIQTIRVIRMKPTGAYYISTNQRHSNKGYVYNKSYI